MFFRYFLLIFPICLEFWHDSTEAVIENDNPANPVTAPELEENICKKADIETFQEKLLSLHNKTIGEIRLLNKGRGSAHLEKFSDEINSKISAFQEVLKEELMVGLSNLEIVLSNEIRDHFDEARENLEAFKSDLLNSLNIEELPTAVDADADTNFDCLEMPDGINRIVTDTGLQFDAPCQNGWLYLMKRFDGSVFFYRDWAHYKHGFGDTEGEFFLGLDNIEAILGQFSYKLKIEFILWDNETECEAEYQSFGVSDEDSGYTLSIGDYNGTCSDQMKYANGLKFSTRDRDNDEDNESNVAIHNVGPGWYSTLGEGSNIFGLYTKNPHETYCQQGICMFWFDEDEGKAKIIKSVSMKIIPL